MKKILVAVLFITTGFAAQAFAFDTPTWDNCVTASSPGSFDTCELSFPAQSAGELTSINNPISGYYHDHGANATHSLEVRVDGSWVSIWSVTNSNSDETIANIPTPIGFSGGIVDGVRFTVDTSVSYAYHSVDDGMTFTFNDGTATAVPTLTETALIMLILSIAGAGIYSQRRRSGNIA